MTIRVCHLIDDASFGGIQSMLNHISSDGDLARISQHEILFVKRGKLTPPTITADVIVSNVAICWANMPLLTGLRARYPRTPLIHIEHGYSEHFAAAYIQNHNRFDTLMRSAYSLFDSIVSVSTEQAQWLLRRGYVKAAKLQVIYPCSSLAEFLSVEPSPRKDKIVVGAIGRLHPQKGFDVLVKAMHKVARDDVELHIYGDGSERTVLEDLAQGDPAIIFQGYQKDVPAAMAAVDVVAMPSRWEPYGLVAIEAMACRRPLVCSNVDGLKGHIHNGALEVSDNSSDGWAAWLRNVTWADLEKGRDRGFTTALEAEGLFAKSWHNLLNQVVGTPNKKSAPLDLKAPITLHK